jgi:hypothetical protein
MPRLRWMFIAAPFVLLMFIAATAYYFEVQKILKLQTTVKERYVLLAEKERSVKEYREKVAFYSTEEGLEHLARDLYNQALPEERFYIIVSASSDVSP